MSLKGKTIVVVAVIGTVATISTLAISVAIFKRKTRGNRDDGKKGNQEEKSGLPRSAAATTDVTSISNNIADETHELPPHLKREIHKDKRRKESVRFLAMKRPMYDNIKMYSQGGILCTISKKKANWYINKQIAVWKSTEDKTAIQLLFDPDVQSEQTLYTVSQKNNICVSCGDDSHFMRHYVVPYCYRSLMPKQYKSHTPHDIVLLCPECHLSCEQATQARQKRMEEGLRSDPESKLPVIKDRRLHHIRSIGLALWKHSDQIPAAVLEKHRATIRSHYGLDSSQDIPEAILEEASQLETCTPNPKYVSGAELVAELLQTDKDIEKFVKSWRQHFLEVVQPRYMPTGWSVDSPVDSDVRK